MMFENGKDVSYTVRGNCTAPPSFPPVNITWLLNGKKVGREHVPFLTNITPKWINIFIATRERYLNKIVFAVSFWLF